MRIYIGTVIHGTMNYADIMPAFAAELQRLRPDGDLTYITDRFGEPDYFASDDADFDCETLFDTLNALAPEGYYFGSHEGDGADYGFWPGPDFEGDVPEFIDVSK